MEKMVKFSSSMLEKKHKWEMIGCSWIRSSISSLQIYELEVTLMKIQIDIFMKLDKLILRFI